MFDLHGDDLVTVYVPQLNVGRVGHVEGSKEGSWAESSARPHPHHRVEPGSARDTMLEVFNESLSVTASLDVGREVVEGL